MPCRINRPYSMSCPVMSCRVAHVPSNFILLHLYLVTLITYHKSQELNEDLVFLRTSSITVEVNMARLFNHSVKLKKLKEGK